MHDCCVSVLKVKQEGRTKAGQRSNCLGHLHTDQRDENKTEEKEQRELKKSFCGAEVTAHSLDMLSYVAYISDAGLRSPFFEA